MYVELADIEVMEVAFPSDHTDMRRAKAGNGEIGKQEGRRVNFDGIVEMPRFHLFRQDHSRETCEPCLEAHRNIQSRRGLEYSRKRSKAREPSFL